VVKKIYFHIFSVRLLLISTVSLNCVYCIDLFHLDVIYWQRTFSTFIGFDDRKVRSFPPKKKNNQCQVYFLLLSVLFSYTFLVRCHILLHQFHEENKVRLDWKINLPKKKKFSLVAKVFPIHMWIINKVFVFVYAYLQPPEYRQIRLQFIVDNMGWSIVMIDEKKPKRKKAKKKMNIIIIKIIVWRQNLWKST
jgi:hypothetical protein